MRKSLIILALYVVGMVAAVIPYIFFEENGVVDRHGTLTFIATYIIIFVLLLYFIVTVLFKNFKPFINRLGNNISLIIGFFGVAFAASIVSNVIIELLGVTDEAANQGGLIDMLANANDGTLIILILLFCLIVPIIEELVYRRGMYGLIRRFMQWMMNTYRPDMSVEKAIKIASIIAIILSGLLFGLIHIQGDYVYLIYYGTAGIVIGTSYYLSKENLYVPIAIHIIQNTIGVMQILALIQAGEIY